MLKIFAVRLYPYSKSKGRTINEPGGGSGKTEKKKTHRSSSKEIKNSRVGCPENKKVYQQVAEEKNDQQVRQKKKIISWLARKKNSSRVLCPRPPRSLIVRPLVIFPRFYYGTATLKQLQAMLYP